MKKDKKISLSLKKNVISKFDKYHEVRGGRNVAHEPSDWCAPSQWCAPKQSTTPGCEE